MDNQNQNIKEVWKSYQENLNKIGKRQKEWQKKLKPKLKRHLAKLARENNLPAEVKTEEKVLNLEAVYLSFGKVTSGMEKRISDGITQPYAKDLGGLFYSQIYNGKISVWYRTPVIEDLMNRKPPQVVEIYEPKDLPSDDMEDHLLEYLKALKEWENQDKSQTGIGF